MALTVRESCAVNDLVSHLLGASSAADPMTRVTSTQARDALAYLAKRAHAKLYAGATEAHVMEHWDPSCTLEFVAQEQS